MGSLVQLGDVPAWISTATSAASLYHGLRNRQQVQALDWAQLLEELAGLTGPELRQVVEENPVIAQMVDLAWEEAARTASEDKRRLLAKVVVAALRGDTDAAEIDELQFLLRTVMALDPAHISLLVVAMPPERPQRESVINRDGVKARWPGSAALLDAALATLEREGLIAPHGEDDYPMLQNWTVGPYGRLFFNFLVRSGETEHTT